MKFLSSLKKEMVIASRSFYFYIEFITAIILLLVILFVVKEDNDTKKEEYLYFDMSESLIEVMEKEILQEDLDHKAEVAIVEIGDRKINVKNYETKSKLYTVFTTSEEDMIQMCKKDRVFGATIKFNAQNKFVYDYYLQGYETQRLKNIYKIVHINEDLEVLKQHRDNQEVTMLQDYEVLNDRENAIPLLLTFNGSLMGLFIICAYVYLDKKEGTIRAFAVTPCPIWQYLLSKTAMMIITSIISSLIVIIPVMKLQPNYLMLIVLLITTGLFSSGLGLYFASFFKDVVDSMGSMILLMFIFIIPAISYMIPTWSASWIKYIPSYYIIQSFKEIISVNCDSLYVFKSSLLLALLGCVFFVLTNKRYKKILSV